jgi:hypothetical protein
VAVDALGIARGWPSIDLPGYREHPTGFVTYSAFDYDALPPIVRALDDDLSWLLAERPVPHSLAGGHIYEGDAVRAATGTELDAFVAGTRLNLAPSFEAFIRTPEPRMRVRSCTACYLDLGEFPVKVGTHGWLVHFLSDQQWVGHWYLYAGTDGTEAVVWTYPPYGFAVGDWDGDWAPDFDPLASNVFRPGASGAVVCADSFSEFLYRFWIENEIWYALAGPNSAPHELTDEQRHYVDHYVPGERTSSID